MCVLYIPQCNAVLNKCMPVDAKTTRLVGGCLGDVSPTKANFRKYLREKCEAQSHNRFSFKYFFNKCFITKLLSKLSEMQTTIVPKKFAGRGGLTRAPTVPAGEFVTSSYC